jgi:hypothetical protein
MDDKTLLAHFNDLFKGRISREKNIFTCTLQGSTQEPSSTPVTQMLLTTNHFCITIFTFLLLEFFHENLNFHRPYPPQHLFIHPFKIDIVFHYLIQRLLKHLFYHGYKSVFIKSISIR